MGVYLKGVKERQKALVRHLASTETANQLELSKASSTSYRTTLRDIDKLESLGLIEYFGEEETGPGKPKKMWGLTFPGFLFYMTLPGDHILNPLEKFGDKFDFPIFIEIEALDSCFGGVAIINLFASAKDTLASSAYQNYMFFIQGVKMRRVHVKNMEKVRSAYEDWVKMVFRRSFYDGIGSHISTMKTSKCNIPNERLRMDVETLISEVDAELKRLKAIAENFKK